MIRKIFILILLVLPISQKLYSKSPPLGTGSLVPSNIMIMLDNSGSMGWDLNGRQLGTNLSFLNHEEVFKIINYLIKDNGKLVIAVPDNKNLDLIKAFLFLPHIHNFSKKSLQFVLNKNKFYVEKTLDFKIDEIFFICSKKKQKIIKFKSSTLKQHFRRYFNSNKIQNPMKSIKMSSYPKQLSKNTNYLSRIIDVDLKVKSNKKDILQFKNSNNKSYFFLK